MRKREREEEGKAKIIMDEERREREVRRTRIESLSYNEVYKKIRTEEIPMYFKRRRKKKERSTITRFRWK